MNSFFHFHFLFLLFFHFHFFTYYCINKLGREGNGQASEYSVSILQKEAVSHTRTLIIFDEDRQRIVAALAIVHLAQLAGGAVENHQGGVACYTEPLHNFKVHGGGGGGGCGGGGFFCLPLAIKRQEKERRRRRRKTAPRMTPNPSDNLWGVTSRSSWRVLLGTKAPSEHVGESDREVGRRYINEQMTMRTRCL
jgi:hypothetical protein